jgi:hypothetical protein
MAGRTVTARAVDWHVEDVAVGLAVVGAILLGLSGFNHFGASWDESQDYAYASLSLSAYRGQVPEWSRLAEGDFVELHGPAYLMASELAATSQTRLRPGWSMLDARHFNNQFIFLAGGVSLYLLTRRLAGRRAALFAYALMATQPLLWGHSFINQKDTPFMALFLASVAAGLLFASRSLGDGTTDPGGPQSVSMAWEAMWRAARQDWRSATRNRKLLLAGMVLAALVAVVEFVFLNRVLWPAIQTIILRAHAGDSLPWINGLFDWIAPEAAHVEAWSYVEKAARAYSRLRPILAILALVPVWLAGRAVFPSVRTPCNSRLIWFGPGKTSTRSVAGLLLAGALLGVTISVRSLGVFGGALVTVFMIRNRRPPVVGVLAYWGMAALACYATWPYLWGDPFGRFVDSLQTMAAFPWQGDILYAGKLWDAGATPWHYLPFLILAQLTLPALVLALIGLGIGLRRAGQRGMDGMALGLLVLWVSVPVATAVALHSIVYDNARQFLFALPPLFILAGVGIDGLLMRLRPRMIGVAGVIAVLAPGVLGILTLHPYEYTYFNSLVGGTAGAYRRFETDYWCTSYREAMERIGATAPPGAVIAVSGPSHAAQQVARADLVIRQVDDGTDPRADQVTFGLACTRTNKDAVFYPGFPVMEEITAGGATLAVIKDFRLPLP